MKSEREKWYDEEIAPKLMAIADQCKEKQMPMVCSIEYEPHEIASTYAFGGHDACVAMVMNYLCARANGNLDSFFINLMRYCAMHGVDVQPSIVAGKLKGTLQ